MPLYLAIMITRYILLVLLISASHVSRSQDKLLLMNGSEVACHILSDDGTFMVFELTKKNGKVKKREVHKSDVFSYTRADSAEHVLYLQDSLFGDIYTEDQMRIYLAGENDGRTRYHAIPTGVVGFLLCGTAAYLGQDGFLTLVGPPVLYALIQLAPKIRIREKFMSSPYYKYNDIYADGFEPPARTKKIVTALKGGYAGAAAGIILYFILK